jgi:selenocysteine lyase/cysteine desulfurase
LGVPGAARASVYIYNDKKEIDQLAFALEKTREIFLGVSS